MLWFAKGSFYQHVVGSSQWDWACSWAHASSADLAHWRHEPVALVPFHIPSPCMMASHGTRVGVFAAHVVTQSAAVLGPRQMQIVTSQLTVV